MRLPSVFLLAILIVAGCTTPATPPPNPDTTPRIVIPRLAEQPSLDEKVGEEEWAQAHEIVGQFDIQDGSPAIGEYPFKARIGATDGGLHLAIQIPNFPKNPWDSDRATYSDCVDFIFTDDADTVSRPSFFIGACTGVSGYTTTSPGYWNGAEWVIDDHPESGSFNAGKPSGGTWARGNVLNGTMFLEVYTARFPKQTERNGLHLQDGTAFRMALLFMRVGGAESGASSPDARGPFYGSHDAYPGAGYTPNSQYDPKGWLRLKMPA